MKKLSKFLLTVSVIAIAVVMVAVWRVSNPETFAGLKSYTLEVVDENGDVMTYTGTTAKKYLLELMTDLSTGDQFSFSGKDSPEGVGIESVNGDTADYASDGGYWALYVEGEQGYYSADSQPLQDGGTYRLVYERDADGDGKPDPTAVPTEEITTVEEPTSAQDGFACAGSAQDGYAYASGTQQTNAG